MEQGDDGSAIAAIPLLLQNRVPGYDDAKVHTSSQYQHVTFLPYDIVRVEHLLQAMEEGTDRVAVVVVVGGQLLASNSECAGSE